MDMDIFDEEFINKVYMYCYKHFYDSEKVRDLAQDILLEAVAAQKSGRNIQNFYAWFWQMAHNKVCMYIKLKNNEAVSLDSFIGSPYEFADENEVDKDLLYVEAIAEMKNAVAKISKIHREVIILFYLKQYTTKQIAQMLNVPEGTVKRRLHDAKNEIKKGYSNSMSNNFQSFAPAHLNKWGSYQIPKHWNNIGDLISTQILVSCIEPKSIKEISDEIGVAPVYFEDKINYLLENKFIKETGKNKYIVDFIIYPQQAWIDFNYELADLYENLKGPMTEKIYKVKDKICETGFYGAGFDFEYLLWILYIYAADKLMTIMHEKNKSKWEGKVSKDNGKNYRIAGSVTYADEKINYPGKWKGVSWSNMHHQFITPKYKVEYANLYEMYPFEPECGDNTKGRDTWINDKNITLLMKIFENPEYIPEENEKEYTANFIAQNIVKNTDGKLYLNLPVMTYQHKKKIHEIFAEELEDIADEYVAKAAEICDRILLPLTREDLLEEYAHWILGGAFNVIPFLFYENKYLQIPEDYSASAAGLCLYIY